VIEGKSEEGDLRSALARLARLIVEEGLEGEAADALGRDYYARRGFWRRLSQRVPHRTEYDRMDTLTVSQY
jgi:hypothetical protein